MKHAYWKNIESDWWKNHTSSEIKLTVCSEVLDESRDVDILKYHTVKIKDKCRDCYNSYRYEFIKNGLPRVNHIHGDMYWVDYGSTCKLVWKIIKHIKAINYHHFIIRGIKCYDDMTTCSSFIETLNFEDYPSSDYDSQYYPFSHYENDDRISPNKIKQIEQYYKFINL